jgi:predicted nuclease with TOPRIM domain
MNIAPKKEMTLVEELRQWDDPHGVKRRAADRIEELELEATAADEESQRIAHHAAELRARIEELEGRSWRWDLITTDELLDELKRRIK